MGKEKRRPAARGRIRWYKRSVAASTSLRIVNPATGAVCAEVAADGPAEVAAAIARARLAQPAWGSLPFAARARALRRLAHRLMVDAQLVPTLMRESGKPRFEAEGIEDPAGSTPCGSPMASLIVN